MGDNNLNVDLAEERVGDLTPLAEFKILENGIFHILGYMYEYFTIWCPCGEVIQFKFSYNALSKMTRHRAIAYAQRCARKVNSERRWAEHKVQYGEYKEDETFDE